MKQVSINSLRQLKPNKSHWNNSETITVRIPKIFKDDILNYAKKLDNKVISLNQVNSTVTIDKVKSILTRIENQESGYKTVSKQIITDLKTIVNEVK